MIRVATAEESAALDRETMASGVPSRALIRSAGASAAAIISERYGDALRRGVAVYAGPGNNGGNAWVVAGAFAAIGVRVRLEAVGESRAGSDAAAERDIVRSTHAFERPDGTEGVVIDGLLGTGAKGALREGIAEAARTITQYRARGAVVVALDIPTGVDATTGAADPLAIHADLTITFGAMKRGLLVARTASGSLIVSDIGLRSGSGAKRAANGLPGLLDAEFVAGKLPAIAAEAHKGSRGQVAIVAGATGMMGAAIHAARAAVASGAGLVRLFVAPDMVPVAQTAAYDALAFPWPATDADARTQIGEWADAILLGPGLGTTDVARAVVERVLRCTGSVPLILDADGLNMFAGRAAHLGESLKNRPSGITPHPGECARLLSTTVDDMLARRFDVGLDFARTLGATVLLKGVPTVITSPDGERLVSATGSPVLATGGSGDILGGMVVALLAQTKDPFTSLACAAWVHGRAAELVGSGVRGRTLDDVLHAMPEAWRVTVPPFRYPVLAELPCI